MPLCQKRRCKEFVCVCHFVRKEGVKNLFVYATLSEKKLQRLCWHMPFCQKRWCKEFVCICHFVRKEGVKNLLANAIFGLQVVYALFSEMRVTKLALNSVLS